MTATLAVRPERSSRPHRSSRWIYVALLVAAIVATVTLTVAAFAGTGSTQTDLEPSAGVPAQHDLCSFAGDARMGC